MKRFFPLALLVLILASISIWCNPFAHLLGEPPAPAPASNADKHFESVERPSPITPARSESQRTDASDHRVPENRALESRAVFSGWVVDSLGNPGRNLNIASYPLDEIVVRDVKSARNCSTDPDGAFSIDVPSAWHGRAIAVVVSSDDHQISEHLQAIVREGQTLLVTSPMDPEKRLRGAIRVTGEAPEGRWLMPLSSARAIIAGHEYADGLLDLGDIPLNLRSEAWRDLPFSLTIFSLGRVPAAYRSFLNQQSLHRWLDTSPVVHIDSLVATVPQVIGADVTKLSVGLAEVQDFGVAWWGDVNVDKGKAHLTVERGTQLVIVGHAPPRTATRVHRIAVASVTALATGEMVLEWSLVLPGPHSLDVQVETQGSSVSEVEVRAVPFVQPGIKVLDTTAWRTGTVRVSRQGGAGNTHVVLSGLAPGNYELQAAVKRRVVSTEFVSVPGEAPILRIPGGATVVFDAPSQSSGRPMPPIELRYARTSDLEDIHEARLLTGVGGYLGNALHHVAAGGYRYSLRVGERYAEGSFDVASNDAVVRVPVSEQGELILEGNIEGVPIVPSSHVEIVGARLREPWLRSAVENSGHFYLRVPVMHGGRGLRLIRPGADALLLQERSPGRWVRAE